ncbi:hypothetical protein HDV62DRAFT_376305 [Trichoderma sp. SZMC 28011]
MKALHCLLKLCFMPLHASKRCMLDNVLAPRAILWTEINVLCTPLAVIQPTEKLFSTLSYLIDAASTLDLGFGKQICRDTYE